jgi:hypothetical protein
MAYEKDPNELGALWLKTGTKGEYLSGTIDGIGAVVCFKAKPTEKGPTWRVLKSQPREDSASLRRRDAREDGPRRSRVDDADDARLDDEDGF